MPLEHLEACWGGLGPLGVSGGSLGTLLGPSWGALGVLVGCSWEPLGMVLSIRGMLLGPLGVLQ